MIVYSIVYVLLFIMIMIRKTLKNSMDHGHGCIVEYDDFLHLVSTAFLEFDGFSRGKIIHFCSAAVTFAPCFTGCTSKEVSSPILPYFYSKNIR